MQREGGVVKIEKRIKELKMEVVELPPAQGIYVPAVQYGNIITTSGQLPLQAGRLIHPGRVGKDVTLEQAQRASKIALMNAISAVRSLVRDLDKVKKIIRLNGFVCSAIDFNDQPKVMNGASELLIDIFGQEIGSHTRCALGVIELPMRSCVELDLTVEIK